MLYNIKNLKYTITIHLQASSIDILPMYNNHHQLSDVEM